MRPISTDRRPPTRERQLRWDEEAYLGPTAIAQFVDLGWLTCWPLCWTAGGLRAARNGYGRWEGSNQRLPIEAEQSGWQVAHWQGRCARGRKGSPFAPGRPPMSAPAAALTQRPERNSADPDARIGEGRGTPTWCTFRDAARSEHVAREASATAVFTPDH